MLLRHSDDGTATTSVRQVVLLAVLAAASLLLNVSLVRDVRSVRAQAPRTVVKPVESYTWLGKDNPPRLPVARKSVRMQVEESAHYALAAPHAEDEWIWTGPIGDHAIRLGGDQRAFAIAMFHQLHCLRILRRSLARGDYALLWPAAQEHIHHCFNYVRQWTLCDADVTLERGDFAERNFTAERVGAVHTCREWEPVYDMVDDAWDVWEEYRIAHGVPPQDEE